MEYIGEVFFFLALFVRFIELLRWSVLLVSELFPVDTLEVRVFPELLHRGSLRRVFVQEVLQECLGVFGKVVGHL